MSKSKWTFAYSCAEWTKGKWEQSSVVCALPKDAAEKAAEWLLVNAINDNMDVMVKLVRLN